MNKKTFLDFT